MQTEASPQAPLDTIPEGKGVLINRNFALLAIGQAISNQGDFVYSTTMLVWVFALTNAAAAVSGVLIAQSVPVFLLGPIAGAFVDRWNRRTTMIITDIMRIGIAVLPLLAPGALRLPAIYASIFLIASFGCLFMPAKSGVLQVIVSEKQQAQAASISQSTFAFSFIIGPAIAAPLYFTVGPTIAILINAASYAVSALCLLFLHASKEVLHPYAFKQEETTTTGIRAVLSETAAGFKFVVTTRILLMTTFMGLIAMLGAGALNALDIVFVSKNLHTSSAFYGFLVAASGIGTLLGTVIAGLIAKKITPGHMLAGSVLLLGIGITFYAFQTWYVAALVVCFLMSIPQGGIEVGFGPLLINSTPRNMMGRAQAVIQTSMFGASLISVALAGYLGQILPVNIIFAVCGLLFALAGLFGWFSLTEKHTSSIQA